MEGNIFGIEGDIAELEEQYSCGVCYDLYTDPRTLPCSHSACVDCLIGIYRKNPSCPYCRTPFALPFPPRNQALAVAVSKFKRYQLATERPQPAIAPQSAPLLKLPRDSFREILLLLGSSQAVGRMALVCKQLDLYLNDPILWRYLSEEDFPFNNSGDNGHGRDPRDVFRRNSQMKVGWERGRAKDFKMTPLRGHGGYITCFALFRKNIVSGGSDGIIKVWRVGKPKEVATLKGHEGAITCLKVNESFVVSGSADRNVRVWDTTTGTCMLTLQHQHPVSTVYFDDRTLFCAHANGLKWWALPSGEARGESDHARVHTLVLMSGNALASISTDSIKYFEREGLNKDGEFALVRTIDVANTRAALIDSTSVACATVTGIKIYNLITGLETLNFPHVVVGGYSRLCATPTSVAFTGLDDGTIRVLDIATRQLTELTEHQGGVNCLWLDDHKLVSAGKDGCIKVWNRKTNTRMYSLLGGTLQGKQPAGSLAGVSQVHVLFDQSAVVASMTNMLRVYSFFHEEEEV